MKRSNIICSSNIYGRACCQFTELEFDSIKGYTFGTNPNKTWMRFERVRPITMAAKKGRLPANTSNANCCNGPLRICTSAEKKPHFHPNNFTWIWCYEACGWVACAAPPYLTDALAWTFTTTKQWASMFWAIIEHGWLHDRSNIQ